MAAAKKLTDAAKKFCTGCKLPLPITEFDVDSNSRIKARCRECQPSSGSKTGKGRRERIVKEQIAALIDQINRGNQLNATVIATGMVAELGGLQAFLRRWAEQIDAVCALKPGSKTALDAFYGIFKTVQASDERMKGFESLRDMSDEDLHKVMFGLLMEQAAGENEEADAAIHALAESRGFKLVPVPESEAG